MIKTFLAKFYEAVIIFLTAFLLLAILGFGVQTWRANHWKEKFKGAEQECTQHINVIKEQQRIAIEKLNEKIFIAENELEAERNNIKVEFRDINHETQKIITNTVYRDCKLDDDGMRNAERARITANSSKPPNSM